MDVTLINKGSRTNGSCPADWVTMKTNKGTVIYKQFWVGPGLAVNTEISSDYKLTEEEREELDFTACTFLGKEGPTENEEPETLEFCIKY